MTLRERVERDEAMWQDWKRRYDAGEPGVAMKMPLLPKCEEKCEERMSPGRLQSQTGVPELASCCEGTLGDCGGLGQTQGHAGIRVCALRRGGWAGIEQNASSLVGRKPMSDEILWESSPGVKAHIDRLAEKSGGWVCEQHPDLRWPHDDCAGPGMLCCDVEDA